MLLVDVVVVTDADFVVVVVVTVAVVAVGGDDVGDGARESFVHVWRQLRLWQFDENLLYWELRRH